MNTHLLEQLIFEKLARTHLSGMAVALVNKDEIIWSRGFGYRDLKQSKPFTPATLSGLASITKQFTCIAILQAQEAGLLSIDDPVNAHLPAFTLEGKDEPIRIKHLMDHTSGLPALAYMEDNIYHGMGNKKYRLPIGSFEDVITFMNGAQDWVFTKPGERWFYLNEGYALLSAIVEKVREKDYREVFRDDILLPLGMERSAFTAEQLEKDDNVATPYKIEKEGNKPQTYPFATSGDGGLLSSAEEMSQIIRLHLNKGKVDGNRVLSAENINLMRQPHIPTPGDPGDFGQSTYGYGLGSLPDFLGHTLIGHSGSLGMATSDMRFIQDEGIGVVVLTNGMGYSPIAVSWVSLAIALGKEPEDLAFVRRDKALERLEGIYETYKATMRATVRAVGDYLVFNDDDGPAPLYPEDLEGDHLTFSTLVNGRKQYWEFIVDGDDVTLIYERYQFRRVGKLTG